jgi:hypothetical protein
MQNSQSISVVIEGDKSNFSSKSAIDRFKRDLKNNDTEKLFMNDYFKDGWTYEVVNTSEKQITVKLLVKQVYIKPKDELQEKRKMLKSRLSDMKQARLSKSNYKLSVKDDVPKDLLDAYLLTKRYNLNIPEPSVILAKPEEFKPMIQTMLQSFGMTKANTNPCVNYFKLLAKYIDLPTTYQPQLPIQTPGTQFVNQLRNERNDTTNTVEQEVDEEMKKIYESLGIQP